MTRSENRPGAQGAGRAPTAGEQLVADIIWHLVDHIRRWLYGDETVSVRELKAKAAAIADDVIAKARRDAALGLPDPDR
jgi:hypothetical protein